MPAIDLSILNQRQTPAFYADVFANRPAAGFVGRIFVSTNTFAFYRDNGTGWDLIGGPGTGTITGSGASGQIALWDGASTITGDTGLTYNGTANSLTASKFIVTGGTSSQFLKGDGSLDSSAYVTTNIYNGNGTLSSERTIALNNFNLIFDGGATTARVRLDADTNVARIFSFATNNLPRFAIRVDGTESGGNTGSDYAIRRYDDAGTFVDAPLTITRSTGQSTFAKKVVIENNAGDQQLQIVSTTAPSIRLDNAQTGATTRAGLGISTATNNFIQGSADRDFCMFNGSTTASPILFGIYDAGLTNTQEAARISPARNFIINSQTDNGNKFQVNGTASFSQSIEATGLFAYIVRGRSADDYGGIGFYANTGNTRYGYIQSHSSNGGQLNITMDGGGQIIGDSRGLLLQPSSGNVAINRTNPEFPLDVNGDIAFPRTSKLQFSGPVAGDRQRAYFTGNGNNDIFIYAASGGIIATFHNSTNTLIGTITDAGRKLQVNGDIYTNRNIEINNSTNGLIQVAVDANSVNSQGTLRWRNYARGYTRTGAGTKIVIPFYSQTNINLVTVVRLTICSADFNSAFGGSTQVTFSVGSLNALNNLSILSSGGNYVSAAINGMNVEITTGAYEAIYMYMEYLTPYTEYSIALGNITLT
jgi:hypothetical protein